MTIKCLTQEEFNDTILGLVERGIQFDAWVNRNDPNGAYQITLTGGF